MKKFFQEFKEFAEKGSAVDMAVGVIVGGAMNGVVTSLVKDVIMPPIGILLGNVDFSQFFIVLRNPSGAEFTSLAAAQAAGATTLNIGLFTNAIISFVIMLFAVFMFVRIMNKIRDKRVTTRKCPYCMKEDVSVAATKCPYCNSALKPVPVTEAGLKTPDIKAIGKKLGKIIGK
ncbi:MAG: large conductance mechanosensitive channel protein MscL [Proteobacteria bacterium]|nr:large conductance mechanosensitive channel protein MscL [Pseudomonadota bacterium]